MLSSNKTLINNNISINIRINNIDNKKIKKLIKELRTESISDKDLLFIKTILPILSTAARRLIHHNILSYFFSTYNPIVLTVLKKERVCFKYFLDEIYIQINYNNRIVIYLIKRHINNIKDKKIHYELLRRKEIYNNINNINDINYNNINYNNNNNINYNNINNINDNSNINDNINNDNINYSNINYSNINNNNIKYLKILAYHPYLINKILSLYYKDNKNILFKIKSIFNYKNIKKECITIEEAKRLFRFFMFYNPLLIIK